MARTEQTTTDPLNHRRPAADTQEVTRLVPTALCGLLAALAVLAVLAVPGSASAAPTDGTRDTGFATAGTGFDGPVTAAVIDGQGRTVVAGSFTAYDGTPVGRIARFTAVGGLDTTFATGTGFDDDVHTLAIDAAGNVVAGGAFTSYDGTPAGRLARLGPTGTLDTAFDAALGSGFDGSVDCVLVVTDPSHGTVGTIVVGGGFSTLAGASTNGIVRLTATGAVDTGFVVGTGFNGTVNDLGFSTGGAVVAAGGFTTYRGTSAPRVARLLPTGALDTSLNVGAGPNTAPARMVVDAGGRIILGGFFSAMDGAPANRIVRLTPTGARDTTFVTGAGFDGAVYALAIDEDGTIVVGGNFTSYQGSPTVRLARLSSSGVLDPTLPAVPGFDSFVIALALHESGDLVVGGYFSTAGGSPAPYVVRLLGGVTVSYDAGAGSGAVPASSTVPRDGVSTVTVAGPGALTRSGYTFTGWNTAAGGGGTPRTTGAAFVPAADTVLHAQWALVPTSGPVSIVPPTDPAAGDGPLTVTTDPRRQPRPGSTVGIRGGGFTPSTTVTVVDQPSGAVLGRFTADHTGAVQGALALPRTLGAGEHVLVASGTAPGGSRVLRGTITLAEGGDVLAVTGTPVGALLTLAAALLLAGSAAAQLGRRRRS